LASHLQEFESNEINKAIFQQKWKLVERLKCQINWGPSVDTLPIYSWSEYEALCINHGGSKQLVCISGVIYDVEKFIEGHPGGRTLLAARIGKDATASFHGGVYKRKYSLTSLSQDCHFTAPIHSLHWITNPLHYRFQSC
jgi:stearoyl-CoA desaturase (delta-9 desaturase)